MEVEKPPELYCIIKYLALPIKVNLIYKLNSQ